MRCTPEAGGGGVAEGRSWEEVRGGASLGAIAWPLLIQGSKRETKTASCPPTENKRPVVPSPLLACGGWGSLTLSGVAGGAGRVVVGEAEAGKARPRPWLLAAPSPSLLS